MKKGTKWVLGTAGTLMAVGLLLRGVGFVMGGGRESRQYYEDRWEELHLDKRWGLIDISPEGVSVGGENGIRVDSGGVSIGGEHGIHVDHHGSEHGESKQVVESGALTGIREIDVEVDCGDIWLEAGEECSVSLDWNLSDYTMSYRVEDGVLKVEDESWGSGKLANGFSIACRVILTVPDDMSLDRLHLSTDMGDISADAAISVNKAELSTDLGDVTCRGLRALELEAESDLGDVAVELPEDCVDPGYSLSTDLGEVYVNGRAEKGSTAVTKGKGSYFVEAQTSLGNVTLEYSE